MVSANNQKPIKILIVEDDDFLIKMYQTGLTHEGFTVITASDGEQVLALAKKEKPKIILLDLILPKKDGFEVLKELKKDAATKDMPVVILSNLGQESDVQRCMQSGAADFLVKANFTVRGVADKVRSLLGVK